MYRLFQSGVFFALNAVMVALAAYLFLMSMLGIYSELFTARLSALCFFVALIFSSISHRLEKPPKNGEPKEGVPQTQEA